LSSYPPTQKRIGRLAWCVLAVVVAAGAVATPASASTAAPGGIGLRLLEVPVNAHDDPRARIYMVDHLAPGTTIRRRVEVSNTTAATTQVAMYAAAATIDKGSFLGADGHTPNDLSTWTSVSPEASDVPTNGLVTATVTITVPTDAAPGEQYGVVWAEARAAPAAPGGITQVSRVGIRVYISVGPGGPPAADFAIDSLTAKRGSDGRPIILASVRNTGGRALDMNGTLDLLDGPGGLSAGPFPAALGTTLAIGDVQPCTADCSTGPHEQRSPSPTPAPRRQWQRRPRHPDRAIGPSSYSSPSCCWSWRACA
jgi:hypothetical protein